VEADSRGPQYFGHDLEAMTFAENYSRWILREFRPYLGRHLTEVGAGSGNFSRLLLETNPASLTALEPSENMFPLLQAALHGHANARAVKGYFGDLHRALPQRPDTCLYVNVLEHVADDQAELEHVWRALAPGGRLCLFVPALPRLFGTADANYGHFRRYQRKPLTKLARLVGFEVEKSFFFDVSGVLPWWFLFRVLKRRGIRPGQVSLYDRWIVPPMSRLERLCRPPVGKNIILIARKPDRA
jgi:SAM-dependent methyltransferase